MHSSNQGKMPFTWTLCPIRQRATTRTDGISPTRPGSKISSDLLQLHGNNYLVMVNYYGDCIELYSLSGNTSANSVIRAMKRQFAHHGISDELITDNGPQFESQLYLTTRQRVQSYCGFTLCQRFVRKASPLPTTTRRALFSSRRLR